MCKPKDLLGVSPCHNVFYIQKNHKLLIFPLLGDEFLWFLIPYNKFIITRIDSIYISKYLHVSSCFGKE